MPSGEARNSARNRARSLARRTEAGTGRFGGRSLVGPHQRQGSQRFVVPGHRSVRHRVGERHRRVDPPRRDRRSDRLERQFHVPCRSLVQHLGHPLERDGEHDVGGHPPPVVVDLDTDRVGLAVGMPRLQKHGHGLVGDVLAHDGSGRYLSLAHVDKPARYRLGAVEQRRGQIGGVNAELAVVHRREGHQGGERSTTAQPSDL